MDIRRSALNLAARLSGYARGGEILATERPVGLTRPVFGVALGAPSAIRLKGCATPGRRLVQVQPDDAIPSPPAPS